MKKLFKGFFGFLLWLICILSITIVVNSYIQTVHYGVSIPMLCGYGYASVETGSMEPNLPAGSFIVLRSSDSYDVGDIVTYSDYKGKLITHRIVEKNGSSVIAKGDSNSLPDATFSEDAIIGVVVAHVPEMGRYIDILRSPLVIMVLIALFILCMLWEIIAGIIVKYKSNRKSIADRKVEQYYKRNKKGT